MGAPRLRTLVAAVGGIVVLACAAGAAASEPGGLTVSVRSATGEPVADAVVIAVPVDLSGLAPLRPRAEQLDQIDKEFVPRVKPVLVGSTVAFPNKDSVRHHVYSFSQAKRFELPLYAGVPSQPVLFDRAGVVVLGCNIHDWMVGYVYVSESPWFAKTGVDGRATLTDMPARRYVVRVWHPELEADEQSTRREIEIGAGTTMEASWVVPLKHAIRVRRAPAAGHSSHY